MADFKTIDNLGVEISTRYAQRSEDQESSIVKYAARLSPRTSISVSRAGYLSAYDELLGTRQRAQQWARFDLPKGFESSSMRIFTHHLLPNIRTDEFGILESDRIRQMREDKKKKKDYNWEERIEEDQEHKESETLLHFFDSLSEKDKNLIEINGRRRQYQKG
ncbi:MAG: DUF5399 family protein [Chlamydiia bacterium]|nr:DUF5399 family protein [Chlamydiia bacterium]MCP5491475.1 DUF5399 family protein [Chlamydiales bacterium]